MGELDYRKCSSCGIPMIRAEWMTGDYCWGCRCFKGNWKDSLTPRVEARNA